MFEFITTLWAVGTILAVIGGGIVFTVRKLGRAIYGPRPETFYEDTH